MKKSTNLLLSAILSSALFGCNSGGAANSTFKYRYFKEQYKQLQIPQLLRILIVLLLQTSVIAFLSGIIKTLRKPWSSC